MYIMILIIIEEIKMESFNVYLPIYVKNILPPFFWILVKCAINLNESEIWLRKLI